MDKDSDIKRIKRKRKIGIVLFIIGWIFIGYGLILPIVMGGVYYYALYVHYIPSAIFGFLLVVVGISLILHNKSKASKI